MPAVAGRRAGPRRRRPAGGRRPGAGPVEPSAGRALRLLRQALGDRLSLAVSLAYAGNDRSRLRDLAALGRAYDMPLLATNAVHDHDPGRRPLQDVPTCVRLGCTVHDAGYRLFPNAERCLKTPARMHRLFADCPQAIRRGLEVAERCTFTLDELRYEYPDEVMPAG